MKKIYIAHPLRGKIDENMQLADEVCRWLNSEEVIPLSPLHAFSFIDSDVDPFKAMQMCFSLLTFADEIWVFGKWWTSEGCLAEICFAGCHGIPIRFKDGELGTAIEAEKRQTK